MVIHMLTTAVTTFFHGDRFILN